MVPFLLYIDDAELKLVDFELFRTDRTSSTSERTRGGGCMIAVKKTFCVHRVPRVHVSVEDLLVVVRIGQLKYLFVTAYIPPQAVVGLYEKHCENFEQAVERFEPDGIFITGDYNLPHAVWTNNHLGVSVDSILFQQVQVLAGSFCFLNLDQNNCIFN